MADSADPILSFDREGETLRIRLPSEVADWETCCEVIGQLHGLMDEQPPRILSVDLAEVLHMQSELLGVLVTFARDITAAGGHVELLNCPKPLREVLRVTRVASLFRIAPQAPAGDAPPTTASQADDDPPTHETML